MRRREGEYVSTLMHTGLSPQDQAATYILMQCVHAHTHIHTHKHTHPIALQRYTFRVSGGNDGGSVGAERGPEKLTDVF